MSPGPLAGTSITLLAADGTDNDVRPTALEQLRRLGGELHSTSPASPPHPPSTDVFTALFAMPDTRTMYGEFAVVDFAWSDPQVLAGQLAAEVQYFYASGGPDRIGQMPQEIEYVTVLRSRSGLPDDVRKKWRNAVPFTSPEQEELATATVRAACEQAVGRITKTAAGTLPATTKAAADLAAQSLHDAHAEILAQADRYLDIMGSNPRAAKLDILTKDVEDDQVVVRGRDVALLIGALRRIQQARRAVTTASGALEVEAAAAQLAAIVATEARSQPVLHRIWTAPDLPDCVEVVAVNGEVGLTVASHRDGRTVSYAERQRGGVAIGSLTTAIWTALRSAWTANEDFASALASDNTKVWRYQPLIERALVKLQIGEGSLAFRAAQDRLDHGPSLSALQVANLGVGALSMAALLVGAAPPVGLALAVAGAALNLASTISDFREHAEQEAAFRAVLSPNFAVAAEPGYLGLAVDIAFNVLDVAGVKEAVTALRLARADKSVAEAAATLVAP